MDATGDRSSLAGKIVPGADTLVFFTHKFHQPVADFPSVERGSLVSQDRFSIGEVFSPKKHQLKHEEIFGRQDFDRPAEKDCVAHSPFQLFVERDGWDKHVNSNPLQPATELSLFLCLPQ